MSWRTQVLKPYTVTKVNTNASAGTNTLDQDIRLAEQESLVVLTLTAINDTSACTSIRVCKFDAAGTEHIVWQVGSRAAKEALNFSGEIILAQREMLRVTFYGCTAGDDLFVGITGHEMRKVEPI